MSALCARAQTLFETEMGINARGGKTGLTLRNGAPPAFHGPQSLGSAIRPLSVIPAKAGMTEGGGVE